MWSYIFSNILIGFNFSNKQAFFDNNKECLMSRGCVGVGGQGTQIKLLITHDNSHRIGSRPRGGSRISGKGVHMYKCVAVRYADFILFSLKYPIK